MVPLDAVTPPPEFMLPVPVPLPPPRDASGTFDDVVVLAAGLDALHAPRTRRQTGTALRYDMVRTIPSSTEPVNRRWHP